jgi:hypothetical protein
MNPGAITIRVVKGALVLGLVTFALLNGAIPAFKAVSSDFPASFTAAKYVREGGDPAKLYDGEWFKEQILRYGAGTPGNLGEFAPYPPPTALLLMPLTHMQPLTALRIVTVLNGVWLVCSTLLLSKIFGWRLVDSALFVLLSGWAIHADLRFGHPYILISTLCLLGYYLYLRRLPLLAGLCLGLFTPIRYYPVIVLAAFALGGQWRVLLGAGIAIAIVAMVSIGVLGWQVHQIFLTDVLLNHLTGHLVPGPRFTAVFQSFDTLFERLLILDPVRNPHPWLVAPEAVKPALATTKGLLALAAVVALLKVTRGAAGNVLAPASGVLGILVLLIAPGTTTYYFVLLWLPLALLIDYFLRAGDRGSAYLILGTYVLIGFIPYGHTYAFEGRGVLSVLAYPRLLLLLVMFVVCIHGLLRERPLQQRVVPLVTGQ